jgi:SAM-dependent methyltransferase
MTATLGSFGEVVGADLSIGAACERFPNISFVAADFNQWKPELEPFDVIVCQEVIEHIEARYPFLLSVKKLLKPNGTLILTTPNAKIVRAWKAERSLQPTENIFTAKELRQLFRNSFEIVGFRTILVGPGKLGYGNQFSGFHRLLNSAKVRAMLGRLGLLFRYDRFLERAGFGLHFVVVARKR